MAGAGLLRARPQSPCLCPRRRRAPWRALSGRSRGAAPAARDRRVYRGGDRGDRLRPANRGGRRQCRAGGGAALCRARAPPRGEAAPQGARRFAGARPARRRFRAGADGSGRRHLHPAPPALRPVPVAERVHRRGDGHRRNPAHPGREAAAAAASWRRVLAQPRRRRGAAAAPPGEGSPRRHD